MRTSLVVKTLSVGYFFSSAVICLLIGILSLSHVVPITLNNQPYYGIKGFVICIIYIPIITLAISITTIPLALFGIWISRIIFKKGKDVE